MEKHTPTPWKYVLAPTQIVSENGPEIIATLNNKFVNGAVYDNAAFIIRAVNMHKELLMCLKEVVDDIPRINKKEFYVRVITKAEGK